MNTRLLTDRQRKSLLLRVDTNLLDEIVQTVFLSAQHYDEQVRKGIASMSQYEALEATKRNIKSILNN